MFAYYMFLLKIPWFWFVILSALYAAATQQNPPRRVRLAGDSLELLCAVGNGSTVMWDLTSQSDTTKSVIIAISRGTGQPVNNKYKLDCNSTPGTCRLMITDLRQTDAGLYRCVETTAQSAVVMKQLADLTVLAAVPTCTTLMSYKTSYLLDDLKIRCQANYSGTEQPFIHCRELSTNISPPPATPIASGNSSYHSLSFTYDIDVDRITKDTRLECITSVNMKDFPHGHVQYTWKWQSDITGEVKIQSNSSPPVSTTTAPSAEASSSSSSSTSEGSVPGLTLVVIGVLVATFVIFMLVVILVLYRMMMKQGVLCSSHDQQCCSPGTTLSASMSARGQTFERPAELYSISDDNEGPVPPLPNRSQSSRDTPLVTESEMRATGCQNALNENTPTVNPTYAELSVSIRTDGSQRLTRLTDTSHAVYADINHLMQTNNMKTRNVEMD